MTGGTVVTAWTFRLLEPFVFGVSASNQQRLVGMGLVLVAMALVAAWWPEQRAVHMDPASILRDE